MSIREIFVLLSMPILSRSVGSCRRLCLCHTITKLLPKLQLFFSSVGEESFSSWSRIGDRCVFPLSSVRSTPFSF